MANLEKTYDRYSPLLSSDEFTPDDLAGADEFLRNETTANVARWMGEHTEDYEYKGQKFRMVVDRPDNGDPTQAFLVASDYGKGMDLDHIMRARIMHRMAAPGATFWYKPMPTRRYPDVMNFSPEERASLRSGDTTPVMGRIAVALGEHEEKELDGLTIYGSSLGATMALEYAAQRHSPTAVAAVELPSVVDRSTLQLVRDFVGNSGQLEATLRENFNEPAPAFMSDFIDTLSIKGLVHFAAGLVHPDNRATGAVMRTASAAQRIATVLEKDGSVVQTFGTVDNVSPEAANQRIVALFERNPRYRGVRVPGAGHDVSSSYAFNGALARVARTLVTTGR
jgi:pimeloyl-ACP methyl ester carboxylesterase